MSKQSIGIKIWGDVSELITGITQGKKAVSDFQTTTASSLRESKKQFRDITSAMSDLAAQGKQNTNEYRQLASAAQGLNTQIKEVEKSTKAHAKALDDVKKQHGVFTELQSELVQLGIGYFGVTAALDKFIEGIKVGIEEAIAEEKAESKLRFALNGNSEAIERLTRFKEQMRDTSLFTNDEVGAAINMGVELGRTELQTRKMVETAMGLANVTGTDLNTAMLALSGTFEGNLGKLGKYAGELKNLTKDQLQNGEAVDILHEKLAKFGHEGLETTAGQWKTFKDSSLEALESVGRGFLWLANGIKTYISAIGPGLGGMYSGTTDADKSKRKNEEMLKTMFDQHRAKMDLIEASIDENKENLKHNRYLEELAKNQEKEASATKETRKETELWVLSLKALRAAATGTLTTVPTEREFMDSQTVAAMQGKTTDIVPGSTQVGIKGGEFGQHGESSGGTAEYLNKVSDAIKSIEPALSRINGMFGQFGESVANVFTTISGIIKDKSGEWGKDFTKAFAAIADVVSNVVSFISQIFSQQNQNRMQQLDEYYNSERDHIENSKMSEEEKKKRLDKLNKETEKERKRLMREQAKDQKTTGIIQAIIGTAVGVAQSLAYGGPIGIALAAIVAALGAVEVATIASQPLPALAQGGLAYGPTAALIGDNPNAFANPEVIAPLNTLKDMFGLGQQNQIEVFGRLQGEHILLSSDRANMYRTRTRGH